MIHHGDHHTNMKALLAFVIVVLLAGLTLLFSQYKFEIMGSGMFNNFMILLGIGMTLLLVLLYLANQPHKVHKVVRKSPSRKKKR